MTRSEEMSAEIAGLLEGLLRNKDGNLKGERLRQLARIGLSSRMSESDFVFVKTEIQQIRKAQIARLEKWHRISGGR